MELGFLVESRAEAKAQRGGSPRKAVLQQGQEHAWRGGGGSGEKQARWAQLVLVVKALAPLGGFRRRSSRGLSWVKGEPEAPPALAPRGMRTTEPRNDGLG